MVLRTPVASVVPDAGNAKVEVFGLLTPRLIKVPIL